MNNLKYLQNYEIRVHKSYKSDPNPFREKRVFCSVCNDNVTINTCFPDCIFCGKFLGEHIGLKLVPVIDKDGEKI